MLQQNNYESSRLKKIEAGAYNGKEEDKPEPKWYNNELPEQQKDNGSFHLSLKDSVDVIAENIYFAQKRRKELEEKGKQNTRKYLNLVDDISDFLDRLGSRVSEVNKEYKKMFDNQ